MTKQIRLAKDTMNLGITSMAGMGAVGSIAALPGMPATGIPGTVGASMNLLNIGQMTKNAQSIMPNTYRKRRR